MLPWAKGVEGSYSVVGPSTPLPWAKLDWSSTLPISVVRIHVNACYVNMNNTTKLKLCYCVQ